MKPLPPIACDASRIGHYGTGGLELSVDSLEDLEAAKPLLETAYQRVGG